VSYSIRWGGNPEDVTIAFSGIVPLEELLAAFDEVRAAPGYHPALRMIHDHRQTDWSAVTGDDIRRRAEAIIAYADPGERHRVAVVVDRKLSYGLMRMREAHTAGRINTVDQVFYDIESARAWLGESPE
jgi:hypothetical protein